MITLVKRCAISALISSPSWAISQKATKIAETGPDVVDDFPELAAVRDGELDVIEGHLGACLDEVLGGIG